MATPTNHWKLGLFVVVGLVVALGAVVYLGAESLRRQHVNYETYFDESVQGLEVGSPILFRGVRVGRVSGIGVAPDRRHVSVSLALFTKNLHQLGLGDGRGTATTIDVPPDLRVQLVHQGITGLKAVQIDFFEIEHNPPPILPFTPPERYIPSAVSTIERLEQSVVGAFDRFPEVADAMLSVASRADRLIEQFEGAQLPTEMSASLAQLDRTLVSFQRALDGAQVGKLSTQAQTSLASVDKAAQHLDAVLAKLDGKDGLIASVQRTTDSVGDAATSAPGLGEELVVTLREVQEAAEAFRKLTSAIERNPEMLLKGRRE